MSTAITIEWWKHYHPDAIRIIPIENGPSRAFVYRRGEYELITLIPMPESPGYRIYFDKLPTTGEEAKLYFAQLLATLVDSLIDFTDSYSDNLGSIWDMFFSDRLKAFTDCIGIVGILMSPKPVFDGKFLSYDSPYHLKDDYWLTRFNALLTYPNYVNLMRRLDLGKPSFEFWN